MRKKRKLPSKRKSTKIADVKGQLEQAASKIDVIATAADDAATTTYSTRFDSRQRELIESAAKQLNWSPARLIRDAAVRRAADIANASGSADVKLRELAGLLLNQLLNPKVEIVSLSDGPVGFEEETQIVSKCDADDRMRNRDPLPPDEREGYGQVVRVMPIRPHDSELGQIRRALATAGTHFSDLLLQLWDSRQAAVAEYVPRVLPGELLQGEKAE
jgi:hypothetical protein